MDLASVSGGSNLLVNAAERTAQTCYMRGLSENIRIQTSSGVPWFHRRICFTSRGASSFNTINSTDTAPIQPSGNSVDTSSGMERLWFNSSINNTPATVMAQENLLFKGIYNSDWNDPILAAIDTARVDLKFDKVWCIRSGNSSGTIKERKLWHPMNKNLVFGDDENGEGEDTSYFSVGDKRGMGDYYVLDIFQAGAGAGAGDLLNVFSNSTLYWHEK